jgi:hypothetical protein
MFTSVAKLMNDELTKRGRLNAKKGNHKEEAGGEKDQR